MQAKYLRKLHWGINISKYRYILNKILFNIYWIYVSPIDTKRCKDRTNEPKGQDGILLTVVIT